LQGNYAREFERQVETRKLQDRVHALGWVERPLLKTLFRHADVLVFPSTFEGFGMPVLEAMAAGVPVACSVIPPLREVAGDAALFFDPYSPHAMAEVVRQILCDATIRGFLIQRGRECAANFTWMRAAEQTLAVLRTAAA
jgi:glycosyltransferase involved in cell wall biosynthesis